MRQRAFPPIPVTAKRWACRIALSFGLWLACDVAAGAGSAAANDTVEVQVRHVGFDRHARTPVVILQDVAGARFLPIWVGAFEARAIAMELDGVESRRPLTHDLMKTMLDRVGVEFGKVIVSALEKNTYFARIHLRSDGRRMEIDSRPSDAIALALRFDRPIFVRRDVLRAGGQAEQEPISRTVIGIAVQDVTEDLVEHFQLSNVDGVVVTDVAGGRSDLHRGDVILALNGQAVRDVADFREKTMRRTTALRLLVRRSGRDIHVDYTPRD